MRLKELQKAGKAFNVWRLKIEHVTGYYPAYSVENMIVWLETDGKDWLKKIKPRKWKGVFFGYRKKAMDWKR